MKWLDKIPMPPLVFAAIFLALMPFFPEPHLWQKMKMLAAGTLSKPIDIFDIFWHISLLIIVAIKLLRRTTKRGQTP